MLTAVPAEAASSPGGNVAKQGAWGQMVRKRGPLALSKQSDAWGECDAALELNLHNRDGSCDGWQQT